MRRGIFLKDGTALRRKTMKASWFFGAQVKHEGNCFIISFPQAICQRSL